MLVLTIRTDKPEAELGLYEDGRCLADVTWMAHKELSDSLHLKIKELLADRGKTLQGLNGIIGYQGPGSFTGLRIGLTVANALAYGLSIPVVATGSDNWIKRGLERLASGQNNRAALPAYDAPAHTTKPTH